MTRTRAVASLAAAVGLMLAGCGPTAPVSNVLPPAPTSAATTASPTPGATPATTGKPTPAPAKAGAYHYVFPVVGKASYAHTHHDYPASDIMAACGSTVRAVINGRVLETERVDTWTAKINAGATRGGLSVSILGDDGVRYYGSHLSSIASGIVAGVRVTAGETIGKVGETGDASACHLHFGISPPCASTGDWWNRRGVIWPWPYLDSWRAGGNKSPVAEITKWQASHGCPTRALVDP